MTTFNELQLSPEILKSLAGLGYDEATEVQAKVIPAILNQKDVLVQSKTGSGKTAAFGIPSSSSWCSENRDRKRTVSG